MSFWSWLSSRLKTVSPSVVPFCGGGGLRRRLLRRSSFHARNLTSIDVTLFHVSEGPDLSAYASPVSGLRELGAGLWRWTALHPEFVPDAKPESPADWPEQVGSVLYDGEDATVLIDPLLPAGDDGFLGELDTRVRGRGLPAAILTTIKFHRRSRDELAQPLLGEHLAREGRAPGGCRVRPHQRRRRDDVLDPGRRCPRSRRSNHGSSRRRAAGLPRVVAPLPLQRNHAWPISQRASGRCSISRSRAFSSRTASRCSPTAAPP